jgi:predicted molibdopterin-dependent oxidoreductase YjgC
MATEERVTYCRICEPLCGLVATVADGELTQIRADGDPCRITSAHGSIELPAQVTDEVSPGTVAIPHRWGHRGEWRRAAAAGGANVNELASSSAEDLERLAGMAFLNGIPVRLEAVAPAADHPAAAVQLAAG